MNTSLPIVARVLRVPEDYTPPNTVQGLLVTIPKYLKIRLQDEGPALWVGDSPPVDTGGIWVKVYPAPAPPQIMVYYGGTWRQMYTGQPDEVRVFVGDPSFYFDSSGRGIVGGGWDGWALCNGANGTTNLQNLFIVPGYYYNEHDSPLGWITNIGTYLDQGGPGLVGGSGTASMPAWQAETNLNLHEGGFAEFQIGLWNLPFLNLFIDFNGGYDSATDSPQTTSPNNPGSNNAGTQTIPFTDHSLMLNTPINRLPPYIAQGFAQFKGYA